MFLKLAASNRKHAAPFALALNECRFAVLKDRLGSPVDLAVPWFDQVHADRPYVVEFDTSVISTADAVARIRDFLASGRAPRAFDALRSRHHSTH